MNRELNSTDIRCLAEGYWRKHFKWGIHRKLLVALVVAILLLGAAVPLLVISSNRSESEGKLVQITPKDTNLVSIVVTDSGDKVKAVQQGAVIPSVERNIKDNTVDDYASGGLILLLLAAVSGVIGLFMYAKSRSGYLAWCVNRWELEPVKEQKVLPNDDSVEEFLNTKHVQVKKVR